MREISQETSGVQPILRSAYELFRLGAFKKAETELEKALALDYEHEEVTCGLKCAHYWDARSEQYSEITDDFERGEYLLTQWRDFALFLARNNGGSEICTFSLKQWVFGQALQSYLALLEGPSRSDPELLYRIGRCHKGIGDYKQALEFLEACSHQKTDDPQILAELADCYALIDEMKAAKIFFREAFFIDPQRIDIDSLESKMMCRLVERLTELGYEQPELVEWLPIYGVVFGVLNVKRELRSLEYGKLKQSIFTLESQLKEDGTQELYLTPRLINRYFWLIDHHISSDDSREKVDSALSRIRDLHSDVYEQYIN